jgi:hypothetical protein
MKIVVSPVRSRGVPQSRSRTDQTSRWPRPLVVVSCAPGSAREAQIGYRERLVRTRVALNRTLQWNVHELLGKLTSGSISPQAEAELATFRDWKGNGSA